jgi:hypothetical protein
MITELGIINLGTIQINYDDNADVLYLSFGKPQECISIEVEDGILLRYAGYSKPPKPVLKLNGITIIDVSKKITNSLQASSPEVATSS